MDLYFLPMSSSLASRIVLTELKRPTQFIEVDPVTGTTLGEGISYRSIHPLGVVPCLRTDEGELLSENIAILSYLSEIAEGTLGPVSGIGRTRLLSWLSFIGTELQIRTFSYLLGGRRAPPEMREHVARAAPRALGYVNDVLVGRDTLLDEFS
ncbi:MAG: glutathione S-transferase, partial [Myxococcota bacterium]